MYNYEDDMIYYNLNENFNAVVIYPAGSPEKRVF